MQKLNFQSQNLTVDDSSEFIYKLETRTAKKEGFAGLDRMNQGELLPRNQKNFKGFNTVK